MLAIGIPKKPKKYSETKKKNIKHGLVTKKLIKQFRIKKEKFGIILDEVAT